MIYRTGWDRMFGTPEIFTDFPTLTLEAARWIAERRIGLLGMDTLTPSTDWKEVHWALLHKDVEIVIVEGLTNLDTLARAVHVRRVSPEHQRPRRLADPGRGDCGLIGSIEEVSGCEDLQAKSAIVTGGATGIGRAIMERLCQEGVSVTFSGISDGGVATERGVRGQGLPRAVPPRRHGRRGVLPPAGRRGPEAMGQNQLPGQQRLLVHRQGRRRHARGLAADDERRPDRLRHDGPDCVVEPMRAAGRRGDRQPVEHLGPHRPAQPLDLQRGQGGGEPA